MTEPSADPKIDVSHVTIIGHISIRDPDTDQTIVRQREKMIEKTTDEHDE